LTPIIPRVPRQRSSAVVEHARVVARVEEDPAEEPARVGLDQAGDAPRCRAAVDAGDLAAEPEIALGREQRAVGGLDGEPPRARPREAAHQREEPLRRLRERIVHRRDHRDLVDAGGVHLGDDAIGVEHARIRSGRGSR